MNRNAPAAASDLPLISSGIVRWRSAGRARRRLFCKVMTVDILIVVVLNKNRTDRSLGRRKQLPYEEVLDCFGPALIKVSVIDPFAAGNDAVHFRRTKTVLPESIARNSRGGCSSSGRRSLLDDLFSGVDRAEEVALVTFTDDGQMSGGR